jgi:hypothetical protein
MPKIILGNQHTTAQEDMRLQALKQCFRATLKAAVEAALLNAAHGRAVVDLGEIEQHLEQAYYMGREDAAG